MLPHSPPQSPNSATQPSKRTEVGDNEYTNQIYQSSFPFPSRLTYILTPASPSAISHTKLTRRGALPGGNLVPGKCEIPFPKGMLAGMFPSPISLLTVGKADGLFSIRFGSQSREQQFCRPLAVCYRIQDFHPKNGDS